MEEEPNKTNPVSLGAPRPTARGSTARNLILAGATLTAGDFYAYSVSVNLGLAAQPDAAYVAAMQVINERIQNYLFFLGFFGAVLLLLAALAVHSPRSGRFRLVAMEEHPGFAVGQQGAESQLEGLGVLGLTCP